MERHGLEDEAQMVNVGLGPLSPVSSDSELEPDDLEEYGVEFASKKRKKSKSIQKIAQPTRLMLGVEPVERGYEGEKPRSPLKEGYIFGEERWDEVMLRSDGDIEDVVLKGGLRRRNGVGVC